MDTGLILIKERQPLLTTVCTKQQTQYVFCSVPFFYTDYIWVAERATFTVFASGCEFKCDMGFGQLQCIADERVCDGFFDCDDESDEMNCKTGEMNICFKLFK